MLTERALDPPDEIQEVVDPLRLRLRVAHDRGAQAPVLGAGTFGEVDESGEGRRFDLGGHGSSVRRNLGQASGTAMTPGRRPPRSPGGRPSRDGP